MIIKKLLISLAAIFIITGSFLHFNLTENTSMSNLSLTDISAKAHADPESGNEVYCYSESRVKIGYTYYDCGPCDKVYDEEGRGDRLKCIYKGF